VSAADFAALEKIAETRNATIATIARIAIRDFLEKPEKPEIAEMLYALEARIADRITAAQRSLPADIYDYIYMKENQS